MMMRPDKRPRGPRHSSGFALDLAAGCPIEALRAGLELGAGSGQGPSGHGGLLDEWIQKEAFMSISTVYKPLDNHYIL
jgi:hypothetical protein